MKSIRNFICVVVTVSVVSACGFQLRGSQDLSDLLPEVRLAGTELQGELGRELSRSLKQSRVIITDDANSILSIISEKVNKRVLSVDTAGRANQYELVYQLQFRLDKLLDEKGLTKEVLPAMKVEVKREYQFDQSQLLAKSDEESSLLRSMREDAMLSLMRRLQYSLRKKASK